jgi:Protein of Unknown function (DUF2784)
MYYRPVADLLVMLHAGFIVFVLTGGLLALHWCKVVWLHLPAVAWAAWIEMSGGICPLTPWENHFRRLAGQTGYEGGFIEHYLLPVIYPETLTRGIQIGMGLFVLTLNGIVYAWIIHRIRKHDHVQGDSQSLSRSL